MTTPYARKRDRREFLLNHVEMQKVATLPGFRGATLHETMGPNWRDIYWSPINRCYVVVGMTRAQVLVAIGRNPLARSA